MGIAEDLEGKIVAWDAQPINSLDVPDFQMYSRVTHLEYK